jgi:hypothetical protein
MPQPDGQNVSPRLLTNLISNSSSDRLNRIPPLTGLSACRRLTTSRYGAVVAPRTPEAPGEWPTSLIQRPCAGPLPSDDVLLRHLANRGYQYTRSPVVLRPRGLPGDSVAERFCWAVVSRRNVRWNHIRGALNAATYRGISQISRACSADTEHSKECPCETCQFSS